jgi:rubredoxin
MDDSGRFLNFLSDSPGSRSIIERFYEGPAHDFEWMKYSSQPGLGPMKPRSDAMKLSPNDPPKDNYGYDAMADKTEILWKCLVCGELKPRNKWVLGDCPACGAKKLQFVLVNED